MFPQINFGEYLLPLAIVKRTTAGYTLDRYAGVAFFLSDGPLVATCRHIVEMVGADEMLMAMDLRRNTLEPVHDVRSHEKFDFAVGKVFTNGSHLHFDFLTTQPILGHDVQTLGFTNGGGNGNDRLVNSRLIKGYVSSLDSTPRTNDSRSLMELSFPSLKGFSGAPIIDANNKLTGMLFSNHQSTIEQFSYQEVQENNITFKESVHKVIELGLAHSTDDIQSFLRDLSISIGQ